MSDLQRGLFEKIQQNANIQPQDILKIVDSVKNADFSDERTVRALVRRLSKLANKPVSKQKEDKIVEAIIQKNVPMDMNTLNKFFKNP